MVPRFNIDALLASVAWLRGSGPGSAFRHECAAGRKHGACPLAAGEVVTKERCAGCNALNDCAAAVTATRQSLTMLALLIAFLLWTPCQSAWARIFAPPPLTLADKMVISDVVIVARLIGAVCINRASQQIREDMVCQTWGDERLHARLRVEKLLCRRDLHPVAEIVYREVWFDYQSEDRPKVPSGARYVVYLNRSFLTGPFVNDRFHAPIKGDSAVPDSAETVSLVSDLMLKGCMN